MSMVKESVPWKIFLAFMVFIASILGYFANDIVGVKTNQLSIMKFSVEQTDRNTVALAAMQRELLSNVAETQRITHGQVERIAVLLTQYAKQWENVAQIQQVVLNEIGYLKRYDELDRLSKERIKNK